MTLDREAAVEFSQHILLCMTSLELIANECSLQRRLRDVRRSLNGLGTYVTGCALSAVRRHGGHRKVPGTTAETSDFVTGRARAADDDRLRQVALAGAVVNVVSGQRRYRCSVGILGGRDPG